MNIFRRVRTHVRTYVPGSTYGIIYCQVTTSPRSTNKSMILGNRYVIILVMMRIADRCIINNKRRRLDTYLVLRMVLASSYRRHFFFIYIWKTRTKRNKKQAAMTKQNIYLRSISRQEQQRPKNNSDVTDLHPHCIIRPYHNTWTNSPKRRLALLAQNGPAKKKQNPPAGRWSSNFNLARRPRLPQSPTPALRYNSTPHPNPDYLGGLEVDRGGRSAP